MMTISSNTPLISIIIPVYNCEKFLDRCLTSVINQTYENLEILVINDGSTDNSLEICNKYAQKDKRIKIFSQENQGVPTARNIGLKNATGEYIAFIDSDDWIEKDMYEYLYNLIFKNNADIAVCEFYLFSNIKDNDIEIVKEYLNPIDFFIFYKLKGFLWCKIFKKSSLKNLFFEKHLLATDDVMFVFKAIIQSKKLIYGTKQKYHYCNDNQKSITRNTKNLLLFQKNLFEVIDYFKKYAITNKQKKLYTVCSVEETYCALGFFVEITKSKFYDDVAVEQIKSVIKKNILIYFFSSYSIKSKIFAVLIAINFKFAQFVYKKVKHIK